MLENLHQYNIILGSNSPRRKELLAGLNVKFEIKTNDTDETFPDSLPIEEIPSFLALKKSASYTLEKNDLLITADTIVVVDEKIVLGKPRDKENAIQILKMISGRMHKVITGVSIRSLEKQKSFHTITEVYFKELDDEEIEFYLENYRPYDKAGAYGVQEWIGYIGVEKIVGSYYNIMGLPIQKLYKELKNWY
jgi:septum formation protein